MSRITTLATAILMTTALTVGVVHAREGTEVLQTQLKASLNTMVQDVRAAETAPEKRALISSFLDRMERRAALIEKTPWLSAENLTALNAVQQRFERYHAELRGNAAQGVAGVPDEGLGDFATFMQNDLEQAAGGVFLSTGVIIILILVLILL